MNHQFQAPQEERKPKEETLKCNGAFAIKQDQDCIDLTDNAITTLSNIPLSPRLRTLLLARNRVASLSPALPSSAPNLPSLVLTSNRLTQLADIDPLARLPRLTSLVL